MLVPAVRSVRPVVDEVLHRLRDSAVNVHVIDPAERHSAYQTSVLALACCGTVNVELAISGTPQVAVWRANWLTHLIIRRVLRPTVPYATLPNLLAHHLRHGTLDSPGDAPPIHECLFERCAAEPIAEAALQLLTSKEAAAAQIAALGPVMDCLTARDSCGVSVMPSTVAARALLHHVHQRFGSSANKRVHASHAV